MLAAAAAAAASAEPAALRLNDIQVIGSHNSFKQRIPDAVMAELQRRDPGMAAALDYHHLPLSEQLDRGVRQLEIDIFADPVGGRFADPAGERLAAAAGERTGFDRAAMLQPGFKVLHVADVDYLSHCATLVRCLGQIDQWSRAHPGHIPIMLTINARVQPYATPGMTDPLPLDDTMLDALDAEIRSVFDSDRLITPDEVRGGHTSLREAVLAGGWPTLDRTRGRIFILFDVPAEVSARYRAGHPSLAGRAMFGWFAEQEPEASVMIVQDPLVDGARIRAWVDQGFIVRTRSDADTREARTGDRRKAMAAIASGAQAVSTDYYPGAPGRPWRRLTVTLPDGRMETCNPVRRPASGCRLDRGPAAGLR
jgi:hypothetical protein